MPRLLYSKYKAIIEQERPLTDWTVPVLPEVVGWDKAPWWLKAASFLVKVCTAGKVDMRDRYSVMLNTVIVTQDPGRMDLATYFHECWHMLQIREAGGWPYFIFKYLFLPFPVLWTYRSRMEWEAYIVSTWVEGLEVLSSEYRKAGKSYTLSIVTKLNTDLVAGSGNRKWLKNVFYSVPYLYMDKGWESRGSSFEVVRPAYFFKQGDVQCIIKVPWREENEYTAEMKGFYQLMHRVLTKY